MGTRVDFDAPKAPLITVFQSPTVFPVVLDVRVFRVVPDVHMFP